MYLLDGDMYTQTGTGSTMGYQGLGTRISMAIPVNIPDPGNSPSMVQLSIHRVYIGSTIRIAGHLPVGKSIPGKGPVQGMEYIHG